MSSLSALSQKEYLKKYLGIGKAPGEKKKKKKKEKGPASGFKIIDDDVDDYNISKEIQEDIEAADEDAPQIVAVIDDRPPSLRVDEKTNSLLWQPLGGEDDVKLELPIKVNSFQLKKPSLNSKNVLSTMRISADTVKQKSEKHEVKTSFEKNIKKEENHSPPRRGGETSQRKKVKELSSENRNLAIHSPRERIYSSGDNSPPRKNCNNLSPPWAIKKEPDDDNLSPLRKKEEVSSKIGTSKGIEQDKSPQRRIKQEPNDSDEDVSPPRKRNRSPRRDKDISPLRKTKKYNVSDADKSPPRRQVSSTSNYKDLSPLQGKNRSHSKDDDISPPRKKQLQDSDGDISPPRKRDTLNRSHTSSKHDDYDNVRKREDRTDRDMSPPRNRRNEDDLSPRRAKDYSPPKKRRNISPERKVKRDRSRSPDRRKRHRQVHSRWGDWSPDREEGDLKKPEKTMSGKRAGLQVAKDLSKELVALKEKEDKIFQNMSEEVSGKNAVTVVRRQKVENPEELARKLQQEKEMKEKYDRWGKGLKQVDNENQKMADQLYEMSKPLARYADDEDLEKYLKEQEREGDPMLAYIRKKKKKKNIEAGIPDKPMYMGEFMPNRFGIRPGYRWDGVDRSNEYEKRWFEKLNARKAVQEEAFKWSTEDM